MFRLLASAAILLTHATAMRADDQPARLISDLTCALPATAWTDADSHVHKPVAKPPAGRWRIIDYKSELYAGRALMTTSSEAAVVTIPLGVEGWHAVSLGISER
jgi:hypothetical protein